MLLKNTNQPTDLLSIEWPVPHVSAISSTRKIPALNTSLVSSNSKDFVYCVNQKSSKPFDDFNLGLHVGDNIEQVLENRQRLKYFFPENTNIQWLDQVHSATVHHVKKYNQNSIVADALYTTEKKLGLAIMTADCLPIFLVSKNSNEIAAIHGGWRPLANNIIANTFKHFNAADKDIIAWLGPCIGETAFEVSEEVYHIFTSLDVAFIDAFKQVSHHVNENPKKYLANLSMIATIQLNQLGITQVINQSVCTVLNPHQYYSYRRDGKTGRMASVICLT